MKFSPTAYASALLEAFKDNPKATEKISERFLHVLERNGDQASVRKIIHEAEKISMRRSGMRMVTIESPRPLSEARLTEFKRHFNSKDRIEVRTNPDLIAGVRIVIDGEWVIDASLRRKLKNLFGSDANIEMRTTA